MSAPPDNHHRSIYATDDRSEPTRVDSVACNLISAIITMSAEERRELLMLVAVNLFADIEIEEDRVVGPSDLSKLGADVIQRLAAVRARKIIAAAEQRHIFQAMQEGRVHAAPGRHQ